MTAEPGPRGLHLAGLHAVVVLSYYGRADTLVCLESLKRTAPACAVVLVDNGSFDGVLEAAVHRWTDVIPVQTGSNLGFSGGMNAGLSVALAAGAAVVTILNNDTEVEHGALGALEAAARTGAAASPEITTGSADTLWFGGGRVDPASGLPRHLTHAEIAADFSGNVPRVVDLITGCCITASADTWRRVGTFDERYFLMFEDSDWSLRARSLKVNLVVLPSARIRHHVSASFTGSYRYLGLFYYTRNGLLFEREHVRGGLRTTGRFVRRHVTPHVVGPARQRKLREAARAGSSVGLAFVHYALHRYGRAPVWFEQVSQRWASS